MTCITAFRILNIHNNIGGVWGTRTVPGIQICQKDPSNLETAKATKNWTSISPSFDGVSSIHYSPTNPGQLLLLSWDTVRCLFFFFWAVPTEILCRRYGFMTLARVGSRRARWRPNLIIGRLYWHMRFRWIHFGRIVVVWVDHKHGVDWTYPPRKSPILGAQRQYLFDDPHSNNTGVYLCLLLIFFSHCDYSDALISGLWDQTLQFWDPLANTLQVWMDKYTRSTTSTIPLSPPLWRAVPYIWYPQNGLVCAAWGEQFELWSTWLARWHACLMDGQAQGWLFFSKKVFLFFVLFSIL